VRRALSAVLGALLLASGAFFAIVAGVLALVVGSDGVAESPQVRLVTPTTAIVIPIDAIDAGLPAAVPTGRATIEVVGLDRRPLFVGAGPTEDVLAYLNGTSYEVAQDADGRSGAVELRAVAGDGTPSPPTAQSLWTAQSAGAGAQRIVVPTSGPEQLAVIMRVDGASPVDVRGSTSVEVEGAAAATIAAAGLAAALLALGLWVMFRPRRRKESDTARPSTPAPEGLEATASVGGWGAPIASSSGGDARSVRPSKDEGPSASEASGPGAADPAESILTLPQPREPVGVRSVQPVPHWGNDRPEGPPREP
jgi:hypothetical protein